MSGKSAGCTIMRGAIWESPRGWGARGKIRGYSDSREAVRFVGLRLDLLLAVLAPRQRREVGRHGLPHSNYQHESESPGDFSPSPSRPGTTSRALCRVSLHKCLPFLREAAEDASSGRGYTGAPRSAGDSEETLRNSTCWTVLCCLRIYSHNCG